MREHECLYFLDRLTVWLKREPTREELTINYFSNHDRFGGAGANMRQIMRRFRIKKLVKERRCSEHCHARHLYITAQGRALLDQWNERGCDSEHRTEESCTTEGFAFKEQHIHI